MKRIEKTARRLHFSTRILRYLLLAYVLMAVSFGGLYYVNAARTTEQRILEGIGYAAERTGNDLEQIGRAHV